VGTLLKARGSCKHGQFVGDVANSVKTINLLGQAAEKVEERSSSDCTKSWMFKLLK
jgi:hypothetical protein